MLIIPHMFGLNFELGEKVFEKSRADQVSIFEDVNYDCGFVFILQIISHNFAVFQLLERFTVCMMKNQYVARFRIFPKQIVLLLKGLTIRIRYLPKFHKFLNLILLDNPGLGDKFLQIDIYTFLHLTGQHEKVRVVSSLTLRADGINIHKITVIVLAIDCDIFALFVDDETSAVEVVYPFFGGLMKVIVDFVIDLWQFRVVSQPIVQLIIGNAKATARAIPITIRNAHYLSSQLKSQLLHIVVGLSITEHMYLIGDGSIGMLYSAAKQQESGYSSQGFNTICGEEHIRAVVEVQPMVLLMPQNRGDEVEDVLCAVYVDEE